KLRHRGEPARIGERAHLRAFCKAIANLDAACQLRQRLGELAFDAAVDKEAGRRNADLTGIAKLGSARSFDRKRDISVVTDNDRRMAAELHRDPLHMLAREPGKQLADRRRAREGDLANDRARDEIFRDFSGVAEYEAQ